MDRLRTLLLSRARTVVLDPDRVASAATRPSRDVDVERFEDELAQLGFVMSLDLAMTVRRLPHQAIQDLKQWIVSTLSASLGAHRPHVPLFRGFPDGTPADTRALYLRRMLSWLYTRADQPCPWCGQIKPVAALDPCGHLVCKSCWSLGSYAGCPICHRRIAVIPFAAPTGTSDRVKHDDGQLRLIDLAFDAMEVARVRFERMLARATPLSKADREEVETVIDVIGPRAAIWMPSSIAIKETMAIAVARLWLAAPDRAAMVKATQGHLRTATDVLRVAVVLMDGDPALVEPIRLKSLPRGLRRAVLTALDKLPPAQMLEDVGRYPGLWKRVGERLHPFELATKLPNVALAFAAIRESNLRALTFADELRSRVEAVNHGVTTPTQRAATQPLFPQPGLDNRANAPAITTVTTGDAEHVVVNRWARPVEEALQRRDATSAIGRLSQRPGELLRRVDHVLRVAGADEPVIHAVVEAVQEALPSGTPNMLLVLASHVRARTAPWSRRVVFPKGEVLRAWTMPDARAPLRTDAIGAIIDATRGELLARATKRKHFARAVIDRALVDLPVPIGERSASKSKLDWPRGSELALPDGPADMPLRLFLHWEQANEQVDLDLSVVFFDDNWKHVATCDFTNLTVGDRAAVHSGDLTDAPPPLGASEFLDLHPAKLAALGARHAVMAVFSYNAVPFDRLTHGFAGVMASPQADAQVDRSSAPLRAAARPGEAGAFDPRAVLQRFDLHGRSQITVPLVIDLDRRRVRWLDVHVRDRGEVNHAGGYRATLAHLGRDFAELAATGARPTLWDVAAIHAAARANVIYIRERDGSVATVRRRDDETPLQRLSRLYDNPFADSVLSKIPQADAPTWVALVTGDVPLPKGSAGFVLDPRDAPGPELLARCTAADLIAELRVKSAG